MGNVLQAVAPFRCGLDSCARRLPSVAHRERRFHIVIENIRCDYYFSEKLVTALAAGCVPIYWGCPSIAHFFDREGKLAAELARLQLL
jgi:hypothetical protein